MIRYTLSCENEHSFESWFQTADAFDALSKASMVTCPECGATKISKQLMAPSLNKSAMTVAPLTEGDVHPLEKMRKEVEANADYVGKDFAKQARAMHDGVQPERAIYGETNSQDAKKLIEDGVPVLPLPFVPTKRSN